MKVDMGLLTRLGIGAALLERMDQGKGTSVPKRLLRSSIAASSIGRAGKALSTLSSVRGMGSNAMSGVTSAGSGMLADAARDVSRLACGLAVRAEDAFAPEPGGARGWMWRAQKRMGLTLSRRGRGRRAGPLPSTGQSWAWVSALGLGAGLMYFFDPEWGDRRRSLIRDRIVHLGRSTGGGLSRATRDLSNRAQGVVAETRAQMRGEDVPDMVLAERVRAALGRAVSHPGAISVSVDQGKVTLRGPVLAAEVERLLATVSSVRGVAGVENRLEVHEQPGDVPGLQGKQQPPEPQFELLQESWSPGVRLLASMAGGVLAISGFTSPGRLGTASGIVGTGLLARGLTNIPVMRLLGIGGGRQAVDLQKTIQVNAPVGEVFEFWRKFENFPRFMSNVEEVKDLGGGKSHWQVKGPAGSSAQWDATITKLIPNEVIAWRSLPGAEVPNAGVVSFRPGANGETQVNVRMSYNPPAGAVGHVVASILGSNPKQQMDEDLQRFKSLIEQGKTTAGMRTVRETDIGRESQS